MQAKEPTAGNICTGIFMSPQENAEDSTATVPPQPEKGGYTYAGSEQPPQGKTALRLAQKGAEF